MDCPKCGSLNPDDAEWCSLCLTRFDKTPTEDPDVVMPAVLPPDPPEVEGAWAAIAEDPGRVAPAGGEYGSASSGPVRRRGEVTVWACPACDTENSLDVDRCSACGTSFYEAFLPPKEKASPGVSRSPELAAALSVVPGGGHAYLGLTAEAVARMFLAVWWIGSAVLIPGRDPALLAVKLIYIIASFLLIGVSGMDAYRWATRPGTPSLLSARALLYTSLGLLFVLIAGGMVAAATAAG